MTWWMCIIIGFWVGVLAGGLATRLFYFPKDVGTVQILLDQDDGNCYMCLQTPYTPTSFPNNAKVSMTVQRITMPKTKK